ncbi:MAG TPA: hypothetical protein VGC95_06695, partial [Chitinophagaceae bacterium]
MRPIYSLLAVVALLISCNHPAKKGAANDSATRAPALDQDSAEGRLAAQLWTFRYDLAKDVPGTLKKIKDLGITYVEGFDAPYIVGNPDKFRSELDAAGLKMFALHWNDLDDWRRNPSHILETAKRLGAHYTGIAWLKASKADTV